MNRSTWIPVCNGGTETQHPLFADGPKQKWALGDRDEDFHSSAVRSLISQPHHRQDPKHVSYHRQVSVNALQLPKSFSLDLLYRRLIKYLLNTEDQAVRRFGQSHLRSWEIDNGIFLRLL